MKQGSHDQRFSHSWSFPFASVAAVAGSPLSQTGVYLPSDPASLLEICLLICIP